MNPQIRNASLGLLAAAAAFLCVPALATGSGLPPEHHAGDVGYVTGGIGEREARLFEQDMPRHRLAIELLEHAGTREAFTADATVRISDRQGRTLLDARAEGPFMLVDLPPGRYTVSATLNRDTLVKRAAIVAPGKLARATFEFPAHTD
jgi:hypothetical protein